MTIGRKIREEKIKEDETGRVLENVATVKVEEVEEDIPMNTDEAAEVKVEGGLPDIPVEEGMTKEQEKDVLEQIANAPGALQKTPAKPRR